MVHVVDFEKTAISSPFQGVLPPSGSQIIAESGMGYPLLGTRETWVVSTIPHTLNLKEVGLARKTESPYSITCYNASRAGRRSFPMEIVGKVAATIQNVLGPEAEELGRATGVIQRRRKFTAVSLLRMLVLTLLRKPDAKATDFQSTAAQLGLDVTSTAVENRFTPQLVGFLRAVLERTVLRVLAASPQTVDLLNKFT